MQLSDGWESVGEERTHPRTQILNCAEGRHDIEGVVYGDVNVLLVAAEFGTDEDSPGDHSYDAEEDVVDVDFRPGGSIRHFYVQSFLDLCCDGGIKSYLFFYLHISFLFDTVSCFYHTQCRCEVHLDSVRNNRDICFDFRILRFHRLLTVSIENCWEEENRTSSIAAEKLTMLSGRLLSSERNLGDSTMMLDSAIVRGGRMIEQGGTYFVKL